MEGWQWVYPLPELGLESKFPKYLRPAYPCAADMRQSSGCWSTNSVLSSGAPWPWTTQIGTLSTDLSLRNCLNTCNWHFHVAGLISGYISLHWWEISVPFADPAMCTGCCQPGADHRGLALSLPALTQLSPGTGNATAIPHHKAKLLQIPVGERMGKAGFELSAAMRPRLSQSSHGKCPCPLACNTQRQQCCILPSRDFFTALVSDQAHVVPKSVPWQLWEGNKLKIVPNTQAVPL